MSKNHEVFKTDVAEIGTLKWKEVHDIVPLKKEIQNSV